MPEKSRKILIFTTAYRPFIGGSEIAISEIIRRLPEWFFDIVTPKLDRNLPAIEKKENFCIHRVGLGLKNLDKLFFPVLGFNYAKKMVRQRGYRLVHAFQASHSAGAAWRLKIKHPKLPFLLTLQEGKNLDSQSWLIKFARRLIFSKADKVTAISNYLKEYALKVNKKLKVEIIPNGVDIENFSKEFSYGELSSLRDGLGIKPGEKVIISVSRLIYKNGLDSLINAFAEVSKQKASDPHAAGNNDYKLLLVGSGPEREKLQLLAIDYQLQDRVIFGGDVGHHDLPKYLKISDVFIRPSRSEGLGSAFLESMAAGVPIIGTPVGGIPDFLTNKKTGIFCKVDDPVDIAEKINLVLQDKDLREELVKTGRELINRSYNWNQIASRFASVYEQFS